MTSKEQAYKMFEVFVGQFKLNNKSAYRIFGNLRKFHGFTITNEIENELEQLIPLLFDIVNTQNINNDYSLVLSHQGKKYINEFTTTEKLIKDIEKDSAQIYYDQTVTIGDITGNNLNNSVLNISPHSFSRDNALLSPTTQTNNNTTETAPPKRSVLEILSWVFGIAIAILGIYEFVIKHFFPQLP